MSVAIRPATPGDAALIARLLHELAAQTGHAARPQVTADDVRAHGPGGREHFRGLVAEQDDQPVGICLFSTTFSGWRGRPGYFVTDLFVDAGARGGGVGRRLLAAAGRQALAEGCSYIRLDVDPANAAAIGFYRRLGFAADAHQQPMFLERPEIEALLARR